LPVSVSGGPAGPSESVPLFSETSLKEQRGFADRSLSMLSIPARVNPPTYPSEYASGFFLSLPHICPHFVSLETKGYLDGFLAN
jgi:hypothetical protein